MSAKRYIRTLALSTAILLPAGAAMAEASNPMGAGLSLTPTYSAPGSTNSGSASNPGAANTGTAPDANSASVASLANPSVSTTPAPSLNGNGVNIEYLDAVAEQPNIHGFAESPFKTSYITPRGLVVEDQGLVWQPVAGLVLPIGDIGIFKNVAAIAGVWNSMDTHQSDFYVGDWNEMDVFVSFAATVADDFNLTLTYGAWNSPPHSFTTEHNIDLKVAYDDSKMWGGGFGLHPYTDIFWAVGGDSTVILGRQGGTGYVELGIVPTYTLKAIPDYPVTFTFPTYFSVGPKDYWGVGSYASSSGNFGVFSAAIDASIPLTFIPARYGFWHADAGVTYFNLLNGALFDAGNIASGNRTRNFFQGEIGFGVNF